MVPRIPPGTSAALLALTLVVGACHSDATSSSSSWDGRPSDGAALSDGGVTAVADGARVDEAFAEVDRLLRQAFARGAFPSVAVVVRDREDREVYRGIQGGFGLARPIAVASASKLASGLVLFSIIGRGLLSLDTTTGQSLGWTGAKAAITLRHLMSFTSGLPPEPPCLLNPLVTLATCVDDIRDGAVVAAPGQRFDYGGAHLQVAGRMAEVATGKGWNELFVEHLAEPLGLSSALSYFTLPRQGMGTRNPLVAGGLRLSTLDYLEILALAFHGGRYKGLAPASPALFVAQAREPFPDAVIGNSPAANAGHPYHYGLAAWLECDTPAQGCAVLSSPGAFGFTPWLDRDAGYYAVIATELGGANGSTTGVVKESLDLESQLQPVIRAALARRR